MKTGRSTQRKGKRKMETEKGKETDGDIETNGADSVS